MRNVVLASIQMILDLLLTKCSTLPTGLIFKMRRLLNVLEDSFQIVMTHLFWNKERCLGLHL